MRENKYTLWSFYLYVDAVVWLDIAILDTLARGWSIGAHVLAYFLVETYYYIRFAALASTLESSQCIAALLLAVLRQVTRSALRSISYKSTVLHSVYGGWWCRCYVLGGSAANVQRITCKKYDLYTQTEVALVVFCLRKTILCGLHSQKMCFPLSSNTNSVYLYTRGKPWDMPKTVPHYITHAICVHTTNEGNLQRTKAKVWEHEIAST